MERSGESGDGLLWVPRVVLFVPRWAFIAVASPLRLTAWAYERYQLRDRFKAVFFNVEGTFGVFPTVLFETTFGLNVGVRLVHKNVFGQNEGFRLRAGFGGEFEQVYEAILTSGDRFGDRFSLSMEGEYQRRPGDLFFGIGNGDEGMPGLMLDPITDETAVRSKFRQNVARAILRGKIDVSPAVSILPSATWVLREFRDRTIAENYDTSRLPTFDSDASNVYGELELRFDTRDRASRYESRAVDATGWLLSGFAGWQQGFLDDPSSFLRYGTDVQKFIDLYNGNRVLALRIFVEAVARTGGDVQEVPFVDLPRLGGVSLLRGYDANRFRDRIVALSSAEYIWDMGMFASAFLFVDAGRPYRVWRDFTLDDMRVGFGGGVQIHTKRSFLGRFHVASGIDGGLFFNFSFDPLYGRKQRVGRF